MKKTMKPILATILIAFGLFINLNYASAFLFEDAPMLLQTSDVPCKDFETPGIGTERVRRCVVDLSAYCDFENLGLPATDGNCKFTTPE